MPVPLCSRLGGSLIATALVVVLGVLAWGLPAAADDAVRIRAALGADGDLGRLSEVAEDGPATCTWTSESGRGGVAMAWSTDGSRAVSVTRTVLSPEQRVVETRVRDGSREVVLPHLLFDVQQPNAPPDSLGAPQPPGSGTRKSTIEVGHLAVTTWTHRSVPVRVQVTDGEAVVFAATRSRDGPAGAVEDGHRADAVDAAGGQYDVSTVISIDGQDRLVSYQRADGAAYTYEYDARGTLTKRCSPDCEDPSPTLVQCFDYDPFGNLERVTNCNGTTHVQYLHDALGRRIGRKPNGGEWTYWLYKDALNPIAQIDEEGVVRQLYVYLHQPYSPTAVLTFDESGDYEQTWILATDQIGTVRGALNAGNGAPIPDSGTDPDEYGYVDEPTVNNGTLGPAVQPFGYAGGLHDPYTGFVRFGARDYDPHTGRWTAKDPVLFSGGDGNLYAYPGNSPIEWVDPYGTQAIRPADALPREVKGLWRSHTVARTSLQDVLQAMAQLGTALPGHLQARFPIVQLANALTDDPVDWLMATLPIPPRLFGGEGFARAVAAKCTSKAGRCAPKGLPDDALVCRGGTCTADRIASGSGVTLDSAGRLQGVSVNSAPGASLGELTRTIPNKQVGVTTVGKVRGAGGDVIPSPTRSNPTHCTMCGITPKQAEDLFTPTVPNPNR